MLNMRRLSWGLILLTTYMVVFAWKGLQDAFFPPPPTPPVYLIDMVAPALAANVALLLLPVCTLLFLGAGLVGLGGNVPEARDRLQWRLGRRIMGPLSVAGLLLLSVLLAAGIGVVVDAVVYPGVDVGTDASLFFNAAGGTLVVALGWGLMIFPAKAMTLWSRTREAAAVRLATVVISAAALVEGSVGLVAAGVGVSMLAANPSAGVPPAYPLADGFTALAAVAGLLVIAWVARRIVHRMRRPVGQVAAVPS